MLKNRAGNLNLKYTFVQCCLWAGYAAVLSFSSVLLLDRGFSNTSIGLVSALGALISVVLQPILASFADKRGVFALRRCMLFLMGAVFVFAALLTLTAQSLVLSGIFFCLCSTGVLTLTPLVNSLGAQAMNAGGNLNFGLCRALGSVSFSVASFFLGRLTASLGAGILPVCYMVIYIAFPLSLLLFPVLEDNRKAVSSDKGENGIFGFFKRYPRFARMTAGVVLVLMSHVFLNSFTYQVVLSKGGDSAQMGSAVALCAMVELPTMVFFGFLLKKMRCDRWMIVSTLFFALKILGTLLVKNMAGFYAVQVLQMLGWGLFSVASVHYVNALVAPHDVVKGQACMTMANAIANVLGSSMGGVLLDVGNVNLMLLVGTVAAFIGAGIVLCSTEKVTVH